MPCLYKRDNFMSRWDPYEDNDPLMDALSRKAAKDGFPLSGLVNFTSRCNLTCVHCYAATPGLKPLPELDTVGFQRIFDEIADLGTLFLTITGGEAMIRQDFKELYSYARRLGFMLTLFSNGTLINDEVVALLNDLPPRHVDISVYGATEATYESITGVKGSYRRCLDGIEMLLKNDIKVRLKSVLMKPNIAEFAQLKKLAESYGLPYRVDSMVFGRFNGDKSPLDLRVSAQKGVECESQMDGFKESVKRMLEETLLFSDKLYNCGAGRTTFSVTETGMLRPCLMITDIEADLNKYSFKEAWNQVSESVTTLVESEDNKCKGCDLRAVCGYCPPMGKLSSLSDAQEKEYFCKIGRARGRLI